MSAAPICVDPHEQHASVNNQWFKSDAEPVADPESTDAWLAEWSTGALLLHGADGRVLRYCQLGADSALLRELGRVREHSFRAVGEGSGGARDIDIFDLHYDHLILLDTTQNRLVGAYRLIDGAAVRSLPALYTATLFDYGDALQRALPQSAELGRSFIDPDYFRSRALDELWRGIGIWLQSRPHIRWLYGAVSASAALPPTARLQLIAYYACYYAPQGSAVAQAKRPVPIDDAHFAGLTQAAAWQALRGALRAMGHSVPALFKHYGELTEPGGVEFLAFGVDPQFSGCFDGLVRVDLGRVKAAKAARWLGRYEPEQQSVEELDHALHTPTDQAA